MACLSLLDLNAQRSTDTSSLLLRHHSASKQVLMRMRGLQVSALVIPVCSMQPWLQVIWHECTCSEDQNSLENNLDSINLDEQQDTKHVFPCKEHHHHQDQVQVCFNRLKVHHHKDIIRALDETRERIASMEIDELKRERTFDQKKYLSELESGDITLRQIQVATNSTKLPKEHVADYIRVNGKLLEPKYSPRKCTYDPYPLPPKRKRDVVSDNIEDALKKVKRAGSR
ncbi:hypothetical protein KCU71_g9062, partial [Aureobasidium melanogenum]